MFVSGWSLCLSVVGLCVCEWLVLVFPVVLYVCKVSFAKTALLSICFHHVCPPTNLSRAHLHSLKTDKFVNLSTYSDTPSVCV